MLTKLNHRQKFITIAGLTVFGTITSSIIGKRLLPQSILTALLFYLITGDRPISVYATVRTIPRDIKWVLILKVNRQANALAFRGKHLCWCVHSKTTNESIEIDMLHCSSFLWDSLVEKIQHTRTIVEI